MKTSELKSRRGREDVNQKVGEMENLYSELLATANNLRREVNSNEYPRDVEQNILDAIVYLDYARENLVRYMGNESGIFRVSPQIVKVAE